MLTEERHDYILKELVKMKRVSVLELVEQLGASESTIRRDLLELDQRGLLKRVHGGAIPIDKKNVLVENSLSERQLIHEKEKDMIAYHASQYIQANDVVYIDSGSTTLRMIDYLKEKNATYVTNGLLHAYMLAAHGFRTICLGGEIRGITETCVGSRTLQEISRYHFTKGFFGTNGVDLESGLTTPDSEEASMKEKAFQLCQKRFVLCDHSKFHKVSPVHFGDIDIATIITDYCDDEEMKKKIIIEEVCL